MSEARLARIGMRTTLSFGVGAIASAAKTVPITSFLMLYYNQVIHLPAIAVSGVLMVSLVLDAFFDPFLGQWSDNFRSRLGRRLPFMYASALPVAILFVMLWIPPKGWSETALVAYLAVCVIGVRFLDTVFYLPHVALIPELTSNYDERTKLFTIRYIFEAFGGAAVGLMAYDYFMRERPNGTGGLLSPDGYPGFAWFTGGVILASILICCIGLHRRLAGHPVPEGRRQGLGEMAREMKHTLWSKPFGALIAAGFFLSIGSGLGSSMTLYWTLYVYQFTQAQLTLLIAPIFLGTFATSIAPFVSARMGKRNAAILLGWIYIAAGSLPLLARAVHLLPAKSEALFALVMAQAAIAPACVTMVLILLGSMMSDLVEDAELRTGRRSEGLLMAANSLIRKATQGLGTLGAGLLLTVVSFPTGAERTQVPEWTLDQMVIIYVAVTVVLFVVITFALLSYRHDKAAHEETLRQLRRRRSEPLVDEPEELAESIGAPLR